MRQAAKERKQERFTALLHHVSVGLLRDSFYALKRQAAPGVDGMTWKEYEAGLEDRIVDLHSRVHRGAYQAQPSRRVYIPQADGRQRPLGIAALEDKLVQARPCACWGAELLVLLGEGSLPDGRDDYGPVRDQRIEPGAGMASDTPSIKF